MMIFRGLPRVSLPFSRSCALTIGNFDGVHLGHQAVLQHLAQQAKARGLTSGLLTFSPHPREFFSPQTAPSRISLLRDKLAAIAACGIDRVFVVRFNTALAAMNAESFVRDVLVRQLQTRYLLIGDDFRFGAKRLGDFDLLKQLASLYGYDLEAMPSVASNGIRVSSTAIRQALSSGRLNDAAALLGRPYAVSGHVIHGAKLGRVLGFPTLNLAFKHPKPAAQGIFAARVFGLTPAPLLGVSNFGVRPALQPSDVNGGRVLLETYCLNWPHSLGISGGYSKIARVELVHKLHDEIAYNGLESLKAGIENDINLAQHYFSSL